MNSTSDIDCVLACDDARYQALLAGDAPALARLVHEELVYVHGNGKAECRNEYLDTIASGRTVYEGVEVLERSAAHDASGVSLSGLVEIRAVAGGKPVRVRNKFESRWVRQGQDWQMVHWMATKVALRE